MGGQERRLYQRGEHFYINAKISTDEQEWTDVNITDLSSGGLQLHTDIVFEQGDELWLDLIIHSFFSEFEVRVRGTVRRCKMRHEHHIYGIAFEDLSQDLKIRIDENVQNDRPMGIEPYLHE